MSNSHPRRCITLVHPFLARVVLHAQFGSEVQIHRVHAVVEPVLGLLRDSVIDERGLDGLLHVLYKVLPSTKRSAPTSTSELLAGVESALLRQASVKANI